METRVSIQSIVRLEDVVARYCNSFRKSNSGKTLKCNCLFHEDKNWSFSINISEQTYECSACKESGNIIKLVQSLSGCREAEVLHVLSDWFNLPIEGARVPAVQKPKKEMKSPEKQCLNHFVHENRELHMVLNALNFYRTDNMIFTAGNKSLELRIAPQILPDKYEMLAGAILFPIRDEDGMLQGFLKYMNEEKAHVCYPMNIAEVHLLGLYQAIESINRFGFVYLVWNSKDLLIMHISGFTNTVACCGKALTYKQINLLLKYTDRVVVIYSNKILNQVKTTKAVARLSFLSATPCRFPLSKKKLSALYKQMGEDKFEYFIRQSARLNFLGTIREGFSDQLQSLTEELNKTESREEKIELRSNLIITRNKLNRLSTLLDKNWEELYITFSTYI